MLPFNLPNATTEYLAVRVAGLGHFLWFQRAQVTEADGYFCGLNGWGPDGARTQLLCAVVDIEARIDSDALPY